MEIVGLSRQSARGNKKPDASKLQIGERFSGCGKFIITPTGQWREVPPELTERAKASAMPPEFKPVGPDGKPIPFGHVLLGGSRSQSPAKSPQYGRRAGTTSSPRPVGSPLRQLSRPGGIEGSGPKGRPRAGGDPNPFTLDIKSRPSGMSTAADLQRDLARKLRM